MGRPEALHPRQPEVDTILLRNSGKGTYETVLGLLREAGIDPADLGSPRGTVPHAARIRKLRLEAKQREERTGNQPQILQAAQEALKASRLLQQAEHDALEAQERLDAARLYVEAAQRTLISESEKLGSGG